MWNEVAAKLAVVAVFMEGYTAYDTFPASRGASHSGFAGLPECHLPEAHIISAKEALLLSDGRRAKRWVDMARKMVGRLPTEHSCSQGDSHAVALQYGNCLG